MWRSPARLIRSLTSSASLDVAVGVLLAVWFTGTVLSERLEPLGAALVCGLGMSLPLVWRRRWPAAVGLVVGAAFLTQSWLGVDPQKEIATIVAIFLAAATHGRIEPLRRSLAAVAALFALAVLAASGAVFAAVVVVGGWLVGRVLLIRSQESQRLAALAIDHEVRARTAVLEERQRIARELHDVVAHGQRHGRAGRCGVGGHGHLSPAGARVARTHPGRRAAGAARAAPAARRAANRR